MKFSSVVVAAMVVLALGGAWINMQLTALHLREAPTEGAFADLCTPGDGSSFDCKLVVRTKWAVLPPNEPDPTTGAQMGIPVALLGWWYFTGVGLWYLLVGRCDHVRRGWHLLLTMAVAGACLVSLFYLYILFFTPLPAKCLWCIISHGINFLLLIGTLVLIPRLRTNGAAAPAPGLETPATPTPLPDEQAHPVGRLVLATVIAVIAMLWCELKIYTSERATIQAEQYKKQANGLQMVVNEFYRDDEALWLRFDSQTPIDVAVRPDDPARGTGERLLPMVVFGDFQCPPCRDFADKLEKVISPDFGNLLHIYWKHLPWSKECNPNAGRDLHPQACQAAYAAEAARTLGGNDAFWKAHDRLYHEQARLATMDYRAFATELGLDPDKFIAVMGTDAVKQRVSEDIAQAKELAVKATPSIFLWGRRVDRNMLANPGFVKRVRERFEQVRNQQIAKQKWESMTPKERMALMREAEAQVKAKADPNEQNSNGVPAVAPPAQDHTGHDHGTP